ncbi:GNAT family N-acetyltransferase [Pseudomonas rubra]|uniref:GNAT family N-acetyltransferase n=1 Tax=Pseudomonas rubra TaxID=2942627 RepID=A0ABT5PE30_9PSED|nr:GNAT family N-acetyltransferase [Pseudomonas rubra]MDD1016565.1 GNAT family N-acetyltransferase [Pseudomonas rubra]MDD1039140.1 GNAT family N-acetyltransferase [Pseudomonas rubra]MDD1157966.1 GNAT family N-acetyltransferase [Pseudomonas rubra]
MSTTQAVTLTRNATLEDLGAMLAFDAYASINPGRGVFLAEAVDKQQCLVAVQSGAVIGYLVLTYSFFDYGLVALVVTSPAHQRQGVALTLLVAAQAACQTEKLFITTNQSNLPSRKLIAKAGFVPSGVIENLDEQDPELIYFKRIR